MSEYRRRDSSSSHRNRDDRGYGARPSNGQSFRDYSRYSRSDGSYHSRSATTNSSRSSRRVSSSGRHGAPYDPYDVSNAAERYARSNYARGESLPRDPAPAMPGDGRYASRNAQAQYAARMQRRRRRRRVLTGVFAALLVVILGAGGVAWAYYNNVTSALHQGLGSDLDSVLVSSDITNEPFYVLLMGTDASAEREGDEYFGGTFRTDTIMLCRVDPIKKTATLISIPRDTQVDLGENGIQKINSAHAFGGAALAVESVEKLTGVPISHYAEINFDGFCSIVDTIDGIEVDVPIEIDDYEAGGYLPAGPQILNGEQALILCRSRNAYADLGAGDLYRSANQRLVLSAIAKKLLSTDLLTITNSVNTLANYITTDLEADEIVSLMQTFKDFDVASGLYSAEFPTDSEYEDDVWYQIADQQEWKTMRTRMEQGLAPLETSEVDPTTGTVLATSGDGGTHAGMIMVRNGTDIMGLASDAAEVISAMGFSVDIGNANAQNFDQTVVVYDEPSYAGEAQEIADALGGAETFLNDGSYINLGKYLVVIGSDYADR